MASHPELAGVRGTAHSSSIVFVGNFKGSEFEALKKLYPSAYQGNDAYADSAFTRPIPFVRGPHGIDMGESVFPCFMNLADAARYRGEALG